MNNKFNLQYFKIVVIGFTMRLTKIILLNQTLIIGLSKPTNPQVKFLSYLNSITDILVRWNKIIYCSLHSPKLTNRALAT